MTKRIAIIDSDNKDIISAIEKYFEGKDVEINILDEVSEGFDLIVLTGFETELKAQVNCTILNVYPSLLPAFQGGEPIKEAFLAGIKVGGVSVHEVSYDKFFGRILAQYPVLIGNTTHIDEYTQEIIAVCLKLYPVVIEAILNDKVFDFSDLFKSSCSGSCGGCRGCH
ncbi:MAG: hypothetical protein K2F57_01015 [Candidatus Gastranaerophilales bacterium]|nr:hypothetical protein [Candidatus Gastranaerophilales bacterium]